MIDPHAQIELAALVEPAEVVALRGEAAATCIRAWHGAARRAALCPGLGDRPVTHPGQFTCCQIDALLLVHRHASVCKPRPTRFANRSDLTGLRGVCACALRGLVPWVVQPLAVLVRSRALLRVVGHHRPLPAEGASGRPLSYPRPVEQYRCFR